jgi:hypothetical protein
MLIKEEGSYYLIYCEKCGAAIRKHKSYCTRYGEAYYFNPELKCDNCGFSAQILNNDSINNPETEPAPIRMGYPEISAGKAVAGVVLTGGVGTANLNEKKINIGGESENCPDFINRRIDVKVETVLAANTVLNDAIQNKMIQENAKVMIVTNFGVVEGTFKPEVDTNDLAQRISMDSAKMRNNYLAKLEKEIAGPIIINNHYFITVLDAKLIPFSDPGNRVTFAVLNLFSDQIAGFTFGEYRQENPETGPV